MNRYFWRDLLLICAGVVVGSLVASLTAGKAYLSWLSFGLTFGTSAPVDLNLGVLRLTFGVGVDITVSTVIFVTLFYVLGRKVIR